MKHLCLYLIFFILSFASNGQNITSIWNCQNNSDAEVKGICSVDNDWLVYGNYKGEILLHPQALTLSGNGNNQQGFLALLSPSGNIIWQLRLYSPGNNLTLTDACKDDSGNMYLLGNHYAAFNGNPLGDSVYIENNTSLWTGFSDIFVLKFDSLGQLLAHYEAGSHLSDWSYSICVNSIGNIIVSGFLQGDAFLNHNADSSSFFDNSYPGVSNGFVLCLNENLQYNWHKKIASAQGNENFTHVSAGNNGSFYLAGTFSQPLDFNPSPTLGYTLNPDITLRYFLARYDSIGNFLWARKLFSTSGNDFLTDMSADASGNVIICGSYEDTIDFNLSNAQVNNLVSAGMSDAFVAKYNETAGFIWAKSLGHSQGNEKFHSLSISVNDTICLSGSFYVWGLNPDPAGNANLIYPNGGLDILIVKLTGSGLFNNAFSIGSYAEDNPGPLALNANNILLVSGIFSDSLTFNPGNNTLYANNNIDPFLAFFNYNFLVGHASGSPNYNNITLNPNPSNSSCFINSIRFPIRYSIFSLHGKLVDSGVLENNLLNLESLKSGVYFLEIYDLNCIRKAKIVKID